MEPTDFKNVIVENLKNESFLNKTSYSSFWSVEATDFKNVILNKIHRAASEAAEVQRSFSRSPRPKFQNHLVFMTFQNRIFVVSSFEVVWPRRPRRPQKEMGEYFHYYIFEISRFHWSKCTLECAIYSILILKPAQARCVFCVISFYFFF